MFICERNSHPRDTPTLGRSAVTQAARLVDLTARGFFWSAGWYEGRLVQALLFGSVHHQFASAYLLIIY
jgi:hypothetical protein